jgi:deoxyribodipyrimidine photolyase
MHHKRILVPLGPHAKDLKSVHYALALAGRLSAQIYILQQAAASGVENAHAAFLQETLRDLINNARQAGIVVSHFIADHPLKQEIVNLVRSKRIDWLVFSTDEEVSEHLLLEIKPLVASQIIQVREKDDMKEIKEGAKRYGTSHDFKHVPGGAG